MSLRRFMHERNKYKEEPNFKHLANLYPEFRKIVFTDITGKVRINFKDKESLKVLTQTLLKHDFNLDIDIPSKNLVPALPLRLNYILWIEDLLKHSGITDLSDVHGIDIGTGATCIYPLLFSTIFLSKMTGTEIDSDSIESSLKNIEKNDLTDFIKVVLVKKESILKELLQDNSKYTFVMCNPPFFLTDKGLGKKSKQDPPRNAQTGNDNELTVKGGEREFISRLIQESIEYKEQVKIYTTMFGQKSTLGYLRTELTKNGISNMTWTEFCQGFTKRWGIAWTFNKKDEINLITAPVTKTRAIIQKLKKDKSMDIVFPAKDGLNSLDKVVSSLKIWISELKIKMKEIGLDDDDSPCWACQLTGYEDTWSHARRKRRMAKREEALKKQRLENINSVDSENLQIEHKVETDLEVEQQDEANTQNEDPLLVCTLLVGEKGLDNESDKYDSERESENEDSNNEKMLRICMIYESGCGGKLSLEMLRQYLVNKLNIREFFRKQQPSKPNKKKRKKNKLRQNK
ncbi:U6 small nuclear RNA (adenine-(43)-N(6))-methyltransferase [Phymastichus coffea]|uniref:U6 small nuclear RNA (adenine-(43)-N(6))-methyltransferase n=1 Tax=Phymastichus coffea TaxID=108790 RepID=UPI00273BCD79|nr:U6 small nuclear RNA (adenine-(43)-N(6))-methyltransferase [Phymastichus coffea]XP_058803330.1 U6 small nuclear RNA (adenine-(43)-N(6))-methyltransferase [Phymastichus coffea]